MLHFSFLDNNGNLTNESNAVILYYYNVILWIKDSSYYAYNDFYNIFFTTFKLKYFYWL